MGSKSRRPTPANPQPQSDVKWLSVSNIEKNPSYHRSVTDVPDLVGSGDSVGGVVSDTVGGSTEEGESESVQLQRIISRCSCMFYYNMYDRDVNPDVAAQAFARGDIDRVRRTSIVIQFYLYAKYKTIIFFIFYLCTTHICSCGNCSNDKH